MLMSASGAAHRVGIRGRGNDAAFSLTVPGDERSEAHMVDRLNALAAAFGVDPSTVPRTPTLEVSDAERAWALGVWAGERSADSPRVLVNISAGTIARRWPLERYAEVIAHLRRLAPDLRLRLIGAPAEQDRVQTLASTAEAEPVATRSLREVAALVATADFVFTPDTSVAHIASAFARPCVAMYLRGTATRWGVLSRPSRNVEHSAATLADLETAPVLEAVDVVWREAGLTDRTRSPL